MTNDPSEIYLERGLSRPMSLGFAPHHPGGMVDNSPTFQRWVLDHQWVQVPKGRLKPCQWSAVPSGLIPHRTVVPNVETLGYCRKSLRDRLHASAFGIGHSFVIM